MDYKEANRSVVDIYLTKEYWKPEYQDLFAKDFVLDLPSAPPGMPQHMDAFDEAVQRSLHRTEVVRITLLSPPTGKRKQYDKNGDEMKYGRME